MSGPYETERQAADAAHRPPARRAGRCPVSTQDRMLAVAALLHRLLGNLELPAISWEIGPANMARHHYRAGLAGHVFYEGDDRRTRSLADLSQWAAVLGVQPALGPAFHQKPDSELFEVVTEIDGVPVHIWTRVPREVTP